MKKINHLATLMFFLSFTIGGFAQIPLQKTHHALKTFKQGKRILPKKSLGTNTSIILNYDSADAINWQNLGTVYYSNQGQLTNIHYSYPTDTSTNNYYIINYVTVAFDSLVDPYNNLSTYTADSIYVDTIIIPIVHVNHSGVNDTLDVQLCSVDANGYPTSNLLKDFKVIGTKISTTNTNSAIGTVLIPMNYHITNSSKFCITATYSGSKIDSCWFTYGFGGFTGNCQGGTYILADSTNYSTVKKSSGTGEYTANSFVYWGNADSADKKPWGYLPDNTGYNIYIPCNNDTVFSPGDSHSYIENINIYAQVSFVPTSSVVYTSISGVTYLDQNKNCTYDTTDSSVPYVGLEAVDSLNKVVAECISDFYGNYTLQGLRLGYTYKIKFDTNSGFLYNITCPSVGYSTLTAPTTNANIAVKCPSGFDLTGQVGACIDTPAFGQVSIWACVYNNGCISVNGTMKLVIDTSIHIPINDTAVFADTLPFVHGDTLMWNYANLGPYQSTYSCIQVNGTIDNLPNNDSVRIQFIATPVAGDSVPSNNIQTIWAHVFPGNCIGLPYDPNGKTVSPSGIVQPTQRLTYTIHFQNTGTASAKNVVVVDTLSANLDPTTLDIISSSSPMLVEISKGNIVSFIFNNINLVDTGTSKSASIGNVIYSIKPISNVAPGATIQNTAGIYFDANAAVITNTATSIITTTPAGIHPLTPPIHLTCFPNPFATSTSVVFNTDGQHYLEVYDAVGRKMRSMQCTGKQYELQRGNLAAGVYFIKAYNTNGGYMATNKIVVE